MAVTNEANDALVRQATAVGLAWADECANQLRAEEREIVGGWPGTLREARTRVLATISAARSPTLELVTLDQLARAANDAARRSWQSISQPDLEP